MSTKRKKKNNSVEDGLITELVAAVRSGDNVRTLVLAKELARLRSEEGK
jgi:hypothetical protein